MTITDHSQVAPRSDGEITRPAWKYAATDAADYLERVANDLSIAWVSECTANCDDHNWHCDGQDLCGTQLCDVSGCLWFRIKNLRAAISKAQGQTP